MLAQRLKQVREENNFSQSEIAKKLGKNQNTISSWETGRTQPKLGDLHALCGIYGCTYEYLTGTRQHDSKDISLDDILVKMNDFDVMDLQVIIDGARFQIEKIHRIENMEAENARLMKQVEEYQKQLEELKKDYPRRG